MSTNTKLTRVADNVRILSAAMVEKAKSGHPGGAMGGADFITVLYAEFLRYDPDNMAYPHRDRFFLDPGHMSPMLYATLSLAGHYKTEDLQSLRQWGSVTPGHPETDVLRGVENTSGPLGQGHAMALGAAIAERFLAARFGEWMAHKTYAYISDGGIEEEISQGVGRIAGHLGLSNFIMYYDANNVQLSTKVDEVDTENVAMKYEAWGWNVLTIDGHNINAIREALVAADSETERPTLIIGRTVMAKGAMAADGTSFEDKVSTHGQPLSAAGADLAATVKNLGGNPDDPFAVFDESREVFAERREQLREWAARQAAVEKSWRSEHKDLARKLDDYFSGKLPEIDYKTIEVKPDVATRAASAAVLGVYAEKVGNMIVSSADLSNSDKTDGFLKKTRPIVKGDFTGQFLQAGVSELTMACVMNGMALHGGVIPACGTFFVFSDYMKPAVRLSALMRLHVIYVWSHDSFRVGEDGPTHQPVEQEMQIRLMEHLKNHRGERSMVVLRPADGDEAVMAWKLALEEQRPVALVLSRQNIRSLKAMGSTSRREEAVQAAKGGYVVMDAAKPAAILIASGSEVSTLVEGAEQLAAEGIAVRVVSVPSEGLFRDQPRSYQESVLPAGVPRYGLTSGLPVTLRGLVGENGTIHGLDHFGYSAPFKVLDEKFGYNGATVAAEVKKMLGR
ncbi:transketolase [Alistipes sp. CAG:268]|jgi:transketolase|uniref:transketolase family protein n=1 Tax=Alistipes sp. CAG:268 TaxID=1262693 RepID=UPI00033AB57A|nr:transketolase [Alistipes sp. CAG:268]CDC97050.1 transketolase [Alistipes sp. CAG:268]HBW02273.1 transketolase [Alistipes sp.]